MSTISSSIYIICFLFVLKHVNPLHSIDLEVIIHHAYEIYYHIKKLQVMCVTNLNASDEEAGREEQSSPTFDLQ